MAKKRLQGTLDEFRVQDKRLVEALDALEDMDERLRPLREAAAEATRTFRVQIKAIREEDGEADLKTLIAEREQVIIEKLKDRLYDGAQVRVGGYVIEVRQVDTIEKVEHGKGWRMRKPMRIADEEGDEE